MRNAYDAVKHWLMLNGIGDGDEADVAAKVLVDAARVRLENERKAAHQAERDAAQFHPEPEPKLRVMSKGTKAKKRATKRKAAKRSKK